MIIMDRATEALNYLHTKMKLCFSDVSKSNILIFKDFKVKFGDFGYS